MSGRRRAAAAVVVGAVLMLAPAARACQSCFGAEDSPLLDGARFGALALVAVTGAVQVGFVLFFIRLRRRARAAANLELDAEWARFQQSPR